MYERRLKKRMMSRISCSLVGNPPPHSPPWMTPAHMRETCTCGPPPRSCVLGLLDARLTAVHDGTLADGRHVGGADIRHEPPATGPRYRPFATILDTESNLSHFWVANKWPRSRLPLSFSGGKERQKGDPRTFTQVAASPLPP